MNKLVRLPFCHMSRENTFNDFKLIVSAIYGESVFICTHHPSSCGK